MRFRTARVIGLTTAVLLLAASSLPARADSVLDEDWGCLWVSATTFSAPNVAWGRTWEGEEGCAVEHGIQFNYCWLGNCSGYSLAWETDGRIDKYSPSATDESFSWHRANISGQGLTNYNYTSETY